MKKKELYRLNIETLMNSGMSRQAAVAQTAEQAGVTYNTVDRSQRKKGKKKTRRDNGSGKRIIVIPDTQVKIGADIEHIRAAARYIVDHRPDIVLVGGDWWDCPSLSVFNSPRDSEGLRVIDDLTAGNHAMDEFMAIIRSGIPKNRIPRLVYVIGNHDPQVRLPRFIEKNPHLEGMLEDTTTEFLEEHGFEVYPFLEIADIEGIKTAHYVQNPHSLKGSPLGGNVLTMLKNAGHSFIMFHQQTYQYHKRFLSDGSVQIGVVAGAFYPHSEAYMSPQGNEHWRGMFMLNEVRDGGGDMCEVSLNYLMRNYGDDA